MKIRAFVTWLVGLVLLPGFIVAAWSDSALLSAATSLVTLTPDMSAQVKISNAAGKLTLENSNPNVVAARLDGELLRLKGKRVGVATMTVKDKRGSVRIEARVVSGEAAKSGEATSPPSTPTTGMTVTPSSLTLIPGQNGAFVLTGVSGSVSLTNSNSDVASANVQGNNVAVQGKTPGTALLTLRDRTRTAVVQVTVQAVATGGGTGTSTGTTGSYTLLAWNDLGMHCMDGDYSVFSILPPYNNLHAQLVSTGSTKLVTSGVALTYEAMADPDNSINSVSSTKTNFWQYVKSLFGASPLPDQGLTGKYTAMKTPQPMEYNAASKMFVAEGIPITPYDDAGKKNTYPLVKVVARDGAGKVLAQARVVLPVSDEMSCASCHASNTGSIEAMPRAGWANLGHPERDYKTNILRLHDDKHLASTAFANAANALISAGKYPSNLRSGLAPMASSGNPVLCASCHASNALPGTGVTGVKPLTEAIHGHHAMVKDAKTGVLLDSITNRSACYQCHPGSETKCLRGAMGNAVDATGKATMDCQSCHGGMSVVGRPGRVGWLDQPNCQACHHDGVREVSAVSATGILKKWLDTRYATNANAPATGFSLYRFSKGHGDLQCEACHGATHAEYPSSHANDNLLSLDVQGRAGTIGECTTCHKSVPNTSNGGPHGMHTVGSAWVSRHGDVAERGASACAYCHGADYRGGALSTVKTTRTFTAEGRTVKYVAGQKVGCYDCHNGPRGD
jgi:hypothetical protein